MNNDSALTIMNDPALVITINDKSIECVRFNIETNTFFFWPVDKDKDAIQVSADNIGFSDWDENEDEGEFNNPFLIMVDVGGVHHTVKFFRNDTLEVIRRIKNVLNA